jgi:plastocyanin
VQARIILIAAAVALIVAGAAEARPAVTTLKGAVGPGFTITLKDSKGKTVKSLKAGTYKIVVSDKSPIHDFVLKGPGLKVTITKLAFTGTKTATVTLKKGKYEYYCTPHEAAMRGYVTVT